MNPITLDLLEYATTGQGRAFWLGLWFGLSLEVVLLLGTMTVRALWVATISGSGKSES